MNNFKFFNIFLIITFLGLKAHSIVVGNDRVEADEQSSDFSLCGIRSGGKIDFRRFEKGKRVDELRLWPYGFEDPLIFSYPQMDIASYPSFGTDSCADSFGKTIMRVEFTGAAAKKLVLAILRHNLQLDEHERTEDLKILIWSGAYIYARGVSCKFIRSGPAEEDKYFYCNLNVLEDFRSAAGGSLSIPKPRMGAGNAQQVIDLIDP